MTISREKYEDLCTITGPRNVDWILEKLDIKVEWPELLPDVAGGKWMVKKGTGDYRIISEAGKDNRFVIADVGYGANAKLMARSKEMAEAMAKCIREIDRLDIPGKLLLFSQIRNTLALPLEEAGANMEAIRPENP
jgi:hypothetical protein